MQQQLLLKNRWVRNQIFGPLACNWREKGIGFNPKRRQSRHSQTSATFLYRRYSQRCPLYSNADPPLSPRPFSIPGGQSQGPLQSEFESLERFFPLQPSSHRESQLFEERANTGSNEIALLTLYLSLLLVLFLLVSLSLPLSLLSDTFHPITFSSPDDHRCR
ncbi:hypothetical protein BD324DRAFT_404618 [Kockovaella imperatae]|uniref:Uncharacterized protein n=1 Tax=Kockovaella imperatae TaxID=4999 RepID=A0A1Y1UII2_9TREE|nr:hypothetical protein BD324DRAFT_404618 [Kockovaella imperatae]ORX37860.1 hypothetical protein BD324DRAFT_404618 [Kockovaella imperatae]